MEPNRSTTSDSPRVWTFLRNFANLKARIFNATSKEDIPDHRKEQYLPFYAHVWDTSSHTYVLNASTQTLTRQEQDDESYGSFLKLPASYLPQDGQWTNPKNPRNSIDARMTTWPRVSLAASANQPLYLCPNLMEVKVKETDNRKQVTGSVQVVGQSPALKGFLSFSLGTSLLRILE